MFVSVTAANCPVAFEWSAGPGNLVLVDSVLAGGFGPAAITLGPSASVNGAVLQNVQLLQQGGGATEWVVEVRWRGGVRCGRRINYNHSHV